MRRLAPLVLLGLAVGGGCTPQAPPEGAVARVGQQALTRDALEALLDQAVTGQDTVALRRALVDQWVSNALLYDAAVREGILADAEVQAQLERNSRAIVVAAYLEAYFEDNPPSFTDEEIAAYFETHREGLRVREPYVEYRLFGAPTEAEARRARSALTARGLDPDTLWQRWPQRPPYTVVPLRAEPERGLFAAVPEVRDVLLSLRPGQASGIVEADTAYFVAQVVARVPEGGEARLEWVRDEIVQRLELDARKQMARRHVQALRARALARGTLTVGAADTLQ